MTTETVKRYDMRFLDCAIRQYEDGEFVKYEDYAQQSAAHAREMAGLTLIANVNCEQQSAWRSRAETAEAELARLRAMIANTVNDWRHLDGHASTPEADEMRQDCADELAAAIDALAQTGGG